MDALVARIFLQYTVLRARSLWLVAFAAIDLVIASVMRMRAHSSVAFGELTRDMLVGFMMPVAAMLLGTAIVREEVERGTLGYWLVRPVPRWRFLVARSLTAGATVAAFASTIFLVHVTLLPGGDLARGLAGVILGAFAWTALYSAFGVLLKRPFVIGVIVLLVEGLLSKAPVSIRYVTVRAHVENIAGVVMELPETFQRFLDPPSPLASAGVLIGVLVASGAITAAVFRRLEFTGSES